MKTQFLSIPRPALGTANAGPYLNAMVMMLDRINGGILELVVEDDADVDLTDLAMETQNQCIIISDPNTVLTDKRDVLMPTECRGVRYIINKTGQILAFTQEGSDPIDVGAGQVCTLILSGTECIAPVSPAAFANKASIGGGMAVTKHATNDDYLALSAAEKADPNVLHIVL